MFIQLLRLCGVYLLYINCWTYRKCRCRHNIRCPFYLVPGAWPNIAKKTSIRRVTHHSCRALEYGNRYILSCGGWSGQWLEECILLDIWRRVVWYKFTGVSKDSAVSTFRLRPSVVRMKAAGFSQTSAGFYWSIWCAFVFLWLYRTIKTCCLLLSDHFTCLVLH